MPRHRSSIPVHSAVDGRIIRRVSPSEADRMKCEGLGIWTYDHRAIRLVRPEQENLPSPTGITSGDMKANAGEFGTYAQSLSRDKITAYRETH